MLQKPGNGDGSAPSRGRRWHRDPVRVAIIIGLIGLFIGVGISTVYRSAFGEKERSDFGVYHAAGRAVLEGTPLYDAVNSRGWYYMYLPPFTIVMVPLSLLPLGGASAVFYLLSVAMLIHMTWLSVRLVEARAGPLPLPPFFMWLIILVATGWMWMSGLGRGQASVMLSWLTIAGVAWTLRGEEHTGTRQDRWRWAGGLALAGASVIRIFPVLFGLWMLGRRQWKSAGVATACLLVVGLILPLVAWSPKEHAALLETWYTTVARPTGTAAAQSNRRYDQMMDPRIPKNQSIQASFIRTMVPAEGEGTDDALRTARGLALGLTGAVIALTALASALAAWKSPARHVAVLSGGAFAIVCLLVPPVTWVHNYSLMVLPLAVVLARVTATAGAVRGLYRIACIAWVASMMIGLVPPAYRAGGVMWGALIVWLALIVDLFASSASGGDDHALAGGAAVAAVAAASGSPSGPNMRSC